MMQFDHLSGRLVPGASGPLYCESIGPEAGFPIVLLPGGGGSIIEFNPLLPHLPPEYRYIGIDFRGHAASAA